MLLWIKVHGGRTNDSSCKEGSPGNRVSSSTTEEERKEGRESGEFRHENKNYQLFRSLLFTQLSSERRVPLIFSAACEVLITIPRKREKRLETVEILEQDPKGLVLTGSHQFSVLCHLSPWFDFMLTSPASAALILVFQVTRSVWFLAFGSPVNIPTLYPRFALPMFSIGHDFWS
ncbi:hypothetical protein CB1_001907007 [Camelus ferus]|nr:hypothetical protein CB1_001907007 [Camelus ferus]